MKIWNGYGSEHSMNLVMIGRFKDAQSTDEAKEIIEKIAAQIQSEGDGGDPQDRFSESTRNLLWSLEMHTLRPEELDQFNFDYSLKVQDNAIFIHTEESDISAILKIMIEKGARVEIYSAHDYPSTGHGRGT